MRPRSPSAFLREALLHDARSRFVGYDQDGDLYCPTPARDLSDSLTYSEYLREHVGPLAQTEIERDLLLDDGGYSEADFGGPYRDRYLYSAAERRGMTEVPFRGTGADDMTHVRYGMGPEGADGLTGDARYDEPAVGEPAVGEVEFGGEADLRSSGLDGGAGDEFVASGSFEGHFSDLTSEDSEEASDELHVPEPYWPTGNFSAIGAEWPGAGPAVPATAPLAMSALQRTGYSDSTVQLAQDEWDAANGYDDSPSQSLFLPSASTTLQPLPQFDGDGPSAPGAVPDVDPVDDTPLSYAEGVAITAVSAGLVGGTMLWLGVKGWWWLSAIPLTYAAAGAVGVAYVLGKANHGDAAAKAWEDRVQSQMLAARLIQRKVMF